MNIITEKHEKKQEATWLDNMNSIDYGLDMKYAKVDMAISIQSS